MRAGIGVGTQWVAVRVMGEPPCENKVMEFQIRRPKSWA